MPRRSLDSLANVQALATLPAGASVETVVDVEVAEKRRRNNGLVGVAQPRLVRRFVELVIAAGLRVHPLHTILRCHPEPHHAGTRRDSHAQSSLGGCE
jgi:hypothetical protein